ncbi:hypothetical protein [Spiroplasma sp. DGKH1]|uniref:hypothetical protein n=1 Tax=Spiroplasma sp. DGKH1 TaxID=3050074 RepID=UPI0034C5C686
MKATKKLTKIRTKLSLPPLTWKEEFRRQNYSPLDRVMKKYLQQVNYLWYFKNVAFYDEKYHLTYFFDRIVLTRKNLYFLKYKKLTAPLTVDIHQPYWNFNNKTITSPIVTQQFMINRVLKLLNAKQFLAVCTINFLIIDTHYELTFNNWGQNHNIRHLNLTNHSWFDVIQQIEQIDEQTYDKISDESILYLHHQLTAHANAVNKKYDRHFWYSLYHFI